MSILKDVKNTNVIFEEAYLFLSRALMKEVDEDFLEQIVSFQPTIDLVASSHEKKELKTGRNLLRNFTEQITTLKDEERKELIADLASEFAELFLISTPKSVYLCESAYFGDELYGKPFFEVSEIYKKFGFKKEKWFKEPEDHISIELGFIANLCRWTNIYLDKGDIDCALESINLHRFFLRNHLLNWITNLSKQLKRSAKSKFYVGLAHLINGFILMDNELLDYLYNRLEQLLSNEKSDIIEKANES